MKLRNLLLVFGLVCSISIIAQNGSDGFYLLRMGQMNGAKEAFTRKIAQNSLDSRAYCGLGEYYLAMNNVDSANSNFQKGITINKNDAYNYLGLAKIALLKNNNEDAVAKLNLARKAGKKDAKVYVEIAKIYMSQAKRDTNEINKAIAKAKEINSKCADIYQFLAIKATEKREINVAANQYESAIYFDSTYFEAYIGYARIMVSAQNPESGINYLNSLIRKMPDCVVAYRELGEIYFNRGKYELSAQNYAKYIQKAEYTPEEKERYAYSLFFSARFDEAKEIIKELSKGDPNNYVMLRLLAYTHYAQKEYTQGIDMFKRFFNQIPENKILTLDYEYYGKTLEKAGLDTLAAQQYQNALKKDTLKTYLLDEISKAYKRAKVFEKAAIYAEKVFLLKNPPQASDYQQLGISYYAAGTDTTIRDKDRRKSYLAKADTLFGTVISINPKAVPAYLMRARTNSIIEQDGITGKAKGNYDKALEIMLATPDKYKKNDIIEVYRYNSFYFLQKDDFNSSKQFCQKILDIDPADKQATGMMDQLNSILNKKQQ